ncbi:Cyclin A [Carabus blaptoides fortunei]
MSALRNRQTEEDSEMAEESNIEAGANSSFADEINVPKKRPHDEVEIEVESKDNEEGLEDAKKQKKRSFGKVEIVVASQENEEGSEDAVESSMQVSTNISSAEDTYVLVEAEVESKQNEGGAEEHPSSEVEAEVESKQNEGGSEERPYGEVEAEVESKQNEGGAEELPSKEVEAEIESKQNEESVENSGNSSMQASIEFEAGSQQITNVPKIQPLEPDAHKPVINMCATQDEKIPVPELSTETTTKITLTVLNHNDIMYQLRTLEIYLVKPMFRFIRKQPYLSVPMRNTQVNFLIHVFRDMTEKLVHKAVYFMDCYLSQRDILWKEMRMLATAAGLLACQFEKEGFQTSNYWIEITGNAFTERELLEKMEMIKMVLNNKLQRPTIMSFIQHIYSVASVTPNAKEDFLVKYICELTLVEGDAYTGLLPSLIASAAVALARHTLYCNTMWPEEFTDITGYNLDQIHEPFSILHRTLQGAATKSRFSMVNSKFMEAKHGKIAGIDEVIKPRGFSVRIFL